MLRKTHSTLLFRLFFISFALSMGLVACREKSEPKREADQQNHGLPGLVSPDDIYCPEGYSYDETYHQCFGGAGVIGPFSTEMVQKCKTFGGGEPCDGLHWERGFAQQLRGKELCPLDTEWNTQLMVCADSEHVYGPFLKTQYADCVKAKGGEACETMRWSRLFFESFGKPENDEGRSAPVGDSPFDFRSPYNSEISSVRSAWATYYYIPTFRDAGSSGYPLLDMAGRRLGASLQAKEWCHASLEGSVRVLSHDGRSTVFNYIGSHEELLQVDCSPWISLPGLGFSRFYRAKGAFGDGVAGYILQPYRTIAVDPGWLPYGTLVYIPAARGAQVILADGSVHFHDGYFFTADTGGALYGNHIDVFIGSADKNPFKFVGSAKSKTFELYVVQNPKIKERLLKAHSAQ